MSAVVGSRYLNIYNLLCDSVVLPSNGMLSNDTYWEVGQNIDLELKASVHLWQGTTRRKFFMYILLKSDGLQRLKKLYAAAKIAGFDLKTLEVIRHLIRSSIYVGKGHGDRPMQHLIDAFNVAENTEKAEEIREVWKAGNGIVIWKCFQNSTSYEANTREAILIDFFNKENLTNIRKGTYYGGVGLWPKEKLFSMGMYYALKLLKDVLQDNPAVILESDVL